MIACTVESQIHCMYILVESTAWPLALIIPGSGSMRLELVDRYYPPRGVFGILIIKEIEKQNLLFPLNR